MSYFKKLFGRSEQAGKSQLPAPLGSGRDERRDAKSNPHPKLAQAPLPGRFLHAARFAQGGFGQIHFALDPQRNDWVIIKSLRPEHRPDADATSSFERELALQRRLGKHVNIVEIQEVLHLDGITYAIMPWIVGLDDLTGISTLTHQIQKGSATNRALAWSIDFCRGLVHCRRNGMRAHLDIKPDNALIDGFSGCLKVSDFGLAVSTSSELISLQKTASTGSMGSPVPSPLGDVFSVCRLPDGPCVFGTPGYMAPELLGTGVDLDRSDIFSLGVVMWQMRTGSALPYDIPVGGTLIDCLLAIQSQQNKSVFIKTHGRFGDVIAQCLSPIPNRRLPNMESLLSALEGLIAENDTVLGRDIRLVLSN